MQKTIKREVRISGLGLHTGSKVNLALKPAPPNKGIVFRRTDLNDFEIEATKRHIARVSYATTLMKKGVIIATVEHLLSALYGLEIDNVLVEVDAMEIPILDGSASQFVALLQEAGITTVDGAQEIIKIHKPIEIRQGEKFIGIYPDEKFCITYEIVFAHPLIQRQRFQLDVTSETYRKEIAPARTFGFYEEIQELIRSGFVRGGSLANAIVLDKETIVNEDKTLRYPDEFVRHKILDLIGDISLVGRRIVGHVHAIRAGHAFHAALTFSLLKNPQNYEIITADDLVGTVRWGR